MRLAIAAAERADLDAVMGLLREARSWHQKKAGRVYVARSDAGICGTVTLMESDALVWSTEDADALYVHKLAVARRAAGQGIGAKMLRWAQEAARQRGRRCLRLDTWDGNRKMRDYYEQQGFRHVRDAFFPAESPLPADYRGTHKSLYQLDV